MASPFANYAQLTDYSTPAIALVEQNGVTYKVQLSPIPTQLLGTASVTEDNLAQGAVTTNAILDGSITGSKLAAGSVTGANLAANSVPGSVLQNGSVYGSALATGSITGANIQLGSVNASALVPNSITTTQLSDASVTSGKLATGCVTSSILADGSVTGAKLAPATIGNTQLQLNCITGANVQYATIGMGNLTLDLQAVFSLPVAYNYSSSLNGGPVTVPAAATNIFVFTAPVTGWFQAWGYVSGALNAGYYLSATFSTNGTDPISEQVPVAPVNLITSGVNGSTTTPFISTYVYLTGGQTLTLVGTSNQTVSATWGYRVIQIR